MGGTTLPLVAGLVVIVGAVVAVLRKVDVRLALLPAALALGSLAGPAKLLGVVHTVFVGFADARTVVPICSAMGFAYVLKQTGCDGHMVRLLTGPFCRASALLIPGTVLVGFPVNIPIISQTGTAVAVGTVLLPILAATRVSPVTAGAALLLGASSRTREGGRQRHRLFHVLLKPRGPSQGPVESELSPVVGEDGVEVIGPCLGEGLDGLEDFDGSGRSREPGSAADVRQVESQRCLGFGQGPARLVHLP